MAVQLGRRWRIPAPINIPPYELEEVIRDLEESMAELTDMISTLRSFKRKGNRGYIQLLVHEFQQMEYVRDVHINNLKIINSWSE